MCGAAQSEHIDLRNHLRQPIHRVKLFDEGGLGQRLWIHGQNPHAKSVVSPVGGIGPDATESYHSHGEPADLPQIVGQVPWLVTTISKAARRQGLHERGVDGLPDMLARLDRVLIQTMGKRKDGVRSPFLKSQEE